MTKFFYPVVLLVALAGCGPRSESNRHEGFVEVEGGRIWYEMFGSGKQATPVVLLHGGPGFTSDYMRPLIALADERPVIIYDQLGAGRSDRPSDTTLWNVERYARELAQLREALELDSIHLCGHSWGTMLATEYMAQNPEGIKSLILAGPCISAERWIADANMLREQLPRETRDTLRLHEAKGTTSSAAYLSATDEFYKRFFCRIPFTPDVQKSFDDQSLSAYQTMWGNNEFTATGNLKNFDRTDVLGRIAVPTLFTCGQYDEATPATTKWYADQVKGAKVVVIEEASHLTMNEKPDEYVRILREFLHEVEK